MNKTIQHELYAEVLQTLIEHLRNRNDVQNIDLMNLSGFCRNCLSKWYVKAAEKRNIGVNGVRFLNTIIASLEAPEQMLLGG